MDQGEVKGWMPAASPRKDGITSVVPDQNRNHTTRLFDWQEAEEAAISFQVQKKMNRFTSSFLNVIEVVETAL